MRYRASALAVALAVDGAVGEVGNRWHPVAVSGRLLEATYRPWHHRSPLVQLTGGAAAFTTVAAAAALLAWCAERLPGRRLTRALLLGMLLKQTFSVRQLLEEGVRVAESLEGERPEEARLRLRALVSRPTGDLSPQLCAAAAIESLAENVADSVAGPLFFYSLFGLAGAAAYRVVNTADAMFGYRGETEWLGKAAARLDDVLNLVPSRLSGLALIAAALLLHGKHAAASACKTWRRDAGGTASPNAGRPMAAMAGALERRLEKRGHYVLGDGYRQPAPSDIRAAARLTGFASALLAAAALLWQARR